LHRFRTVFLNVNCKMKFSFEHTVTIFLLIFLSKQTNKSSLQSKAVTYFWVQL